ncbi:MAG: hypothetical protein DRJ10_06820 [Bacteroidetes bacterium]|nr:MAG: hypothetical protein DRJ10_06820 [Bacteroidota bacterium]RLD81347.1 MAG: hypothetical protein DRJ07_09380 [Bacteroidota bacterium]
MKFKIIVLFSLFVSFSACKTQKQTIVNPRENLVSAISDAIQLLENKNYQSFIEKYAMPEDLEKILKRESMDELVESFSDGKAEKVLNALKLASELEPKYDESGNKAIFSKGDVGGMSKDMVFRKVDKYWYIAN